MNMTSENERRTRFREVLFSLASMEDITVIKDDLKKVYWELESIYLTDSEPHFRHFYSDIYSVITEIQRSKDKANLEYLLLNIEKLRENYHAYKAEGQSTQDISSNLKKLYDHLSLEMARSSFIHYEIRSTVGQDSLTSAKDIKTYVEDKYTNLDETMNEKYSQIIDTLDHTQKEYISILGIFAAVILAFTGGIVFSSSVLDNIAQASIYRTVFISLIIGLVTTNTVFILLNFLSTFVKNTSTQKIEKWQIFINVRLILGLLATLTLWHFGAVQIRNQNFFSSLF